MPNRPQAPSTLVLLTAAFATILLTLSAAGLVIHREGLQISRQTREILDNGMPSIVSAARMKEILPQLRLAERECDRDSVVSKDSFERGVSHFEGILAREDHAALEFPDERAYRQDIHRRLHVVIAEDQGLRAAVRRDDPRAVALIKARVDADLGGLERACLLWEQLNQTGVRSAQSILYAISAHEQAVMDGAVLLLVVMGLGWAVMLARAIAIPLAQLKQAMRVFPGANSDLAVQLVSWSPQELRDLVQTFRETSELLREASEQRERDQAQLAAINAGLDEQVRFKTSALEHANLKLSELVEELNERDRSKSAFLASVSHELRTPLAVIKGAALTMLSLEARLDVDARHVLASHIEEEAEHLSSLVEDLLDVARMESGSFRISPVPEVPMLPLVESVVGGLSTLFEGHPILLTLPSDASLPPVSADPERLRQVLRNLIENAAKFSPPGARIELRVRCCEADELPRRLEISVDDAGMGVPPELLPRLFTPFSRGDTAKGGTGLGLAIAKQLVEAHGGGIGLRPSSQGGSSFWFWLPIAGSHFVTG